MYVFKCVSESRFNFIIALTTHRFPSIRNRKWLVCRCFFHLDCLCCCVSSVGLIHRRQQHRMRQVDPVFCYVQILFLSMAEQRWIELLSYPIRKTLLRGEVQHLGEATCSVLSPKGHFKRTQLCSYILKDIRIEFIAMYMQGI